MRVGQPLNVNLLLVFALAVVAGCWIVYVLVRRCHYRYVDRAQIRLARDWNAVRNSPSYVGLSEYGRWLIGQPRVPSVAQWKVWKGWKGLV